MKLLLGFLSSLLVAVGLAYEYSARTAEISFTCAFPSEESKSGSLWEELQNRIKLCKVEAVSPGLAFDRNSALFKRPSLTEQELCQFSGALCHVKQTERCSVCLCSAVLQSGPWAISATVMLRVCVWGG